MTLITISPSHLSAYITLSSSRFCVFTVVGLTLRNPTSTEFAKRHKKQLTLTRLVYQNVIRFGLCRNCFGWIMCYQNQTHKKNYWRFKYYTYKKCIIISTLHGNYNKPKAASKFKFRKITCGTKCRMRFGENCFWAQMCQIRLHTFSR